MFKFPIVDLLIIICGVFLAWGFAWKAHWYINNEHYLKAIQYILLSLTMLGIAFAEAYFTTP